MLDNELLVEARHLSRGRAPAWDAREMPEGYLAELINYRFTKRGSVVKRGGTVSHGSGAAFIQSMIYFEPDNHPAVVLYAEGGALKRLTVSGMATVEDGFFGHELGAGLGAWSWAVRRGILYGMNAVDGLISWDGSPTGGVQRYPGVTKAACIGQFNGLLVTGGLEGASDVVAWTDGGTDRIRFTSDYWAALSTGVSPGVDRVIAIAPMNWQLFAITARSVYLLRESGSLNYLPLRIPDSVGCAALDSMAELPCGSLVYLSDAGGAFRIVRFDGRSTKELSGPISSDMAKIDRSRLEQVASVYYDGMYLLSVPELGGDNAVHVWDEELNAWARWEGCAFTTATVRNGELILGGCGWLQNLGTDIMLYPYGDIDGPEAISSEIRTPFIQAGQRNAKAVRAVGIEAVRAGNGSFTVEVYKDHNRHPATWSDGGTSGSLSLLPEAPYFYWGETGAVLDGSDVRFGPCKRSWLEAVIPGRAARALQIRLTESALQGVEVFGCQLYGKRTSKG